MRAKRIQHLNYLREKVTHEGSVVTLVYAGQIFDYRRKKFISPSILSFSVKQGLRFPIRDKHELRVSGHLVTSNGFGDGSIKLRYTHNFSPLTNVSLASSTSWNVITLHARVWRQVTDDIAAGLRVGLIGDHNVRLTLDKELSDNLKASAEMEWSQNPSVSVGLGKENEEGTFYTGSVTTSKKNMGVTASAGLQVTEKTSIGGSMNLKSKYEFSSLESVLSMLKFTFSGHVERSISEITKAHVAFTIANYGVYISFGITRLGQTYQLPLYISNRVTVSSVMTAFMYPLSIVYLVNALFVVPRRRRRLLEKQTKRREELNKLIKTYKEKADAFKESIAIDVKKMQEMEDEKGGLVIIQAFYGKPPEMNQTINEESISAEDCVIDVTLPLQYMVRNSKLQLPETSKSHLVGFYDPCPGEEKTLEIVYLFRNQMHRVTIPDTARLRIPIKCMYYHINNILIRLTS